MLITIQEQEKLLKEYSIEKSSTVRQDQAFVDGMKAAFKLVDQKLKNKTR